MINCKIYITYETCFTNSVVDDLINRYVYIFYYKGDMNHEEI